MASPQILTPVGRLVSGNPFKGYLAKDDNGVPKTDKNGQQYNEYNYGIAFSHADFDTYIWPTMYAEIATGFPNGAPQNFAYKFKDGDTAVTNDNVPYNTMPGRAGCKILFVTTRFPPAVFKLNAGGTYDQLTEDQMKTGDHIRLKLSFTVNVSTSANRKSSIYVNPDEIEHVAYDTEISTGYKADPNAAFGGQAAPIPHGASATPVAPAAPVGMPTAAPPVAPAPAAPMAAPPVAPAPAAPMAAPPVAPAPVAPMAAPPVAPVAPVAPAPAYAPPAAGFAHGGAPVAPAPVVPAAPVAPAPAAPVPGAMPPR